MKYNPENELTETELDELGKANFDAFLEYLDEKAAYLKQFTQPLGQYHTKQFASITKGGELTTKELKRAKEIGRVGDDMRANSIREATKELGDDPKFRDPGIKNIKTKRTQWFD
jgi:hypothetical protein